MALWLVQMVNTVSVQFTKTEVNIGSLQSIRTNKKQYTLPLCVPVLSVIYDLQSVLDKLFFCDWREYPGLVNSENTLEDAFMASSIE
jgi:hypothetical protein